MPTIRLQYFARKTPIKTLIRASKDTDMESIPLMEAAPPLFETDNTAAIPSMIPSARKLLNRVSLTLTPIFVEIRWLLPMVLTW